MGKLAESTVIVAEAPANSEQIHYTFDRSTTFWVLSALQEQVIYTSPLLEVKFAPVGGGK